MKNIIRAMLIICVLCAVCLACSCSKTEVSITFDPRNGAEPTTVSLENDSFEAPAAPEKSGFTFGGWFYDKDVWQNKFSTSDVASAQNSLTATVYAKWEILPVVSITFDPCNGGDATTVIMQNGIFEKPAAPEKAGCTFGGWFYDKDVWQEPFSTSDVTNAKNHLTATVYAKWNIIPITQMASFESATYTYDGSPKTIEVTGLVDGMSVEYKSNNSFTDAGVYDIHAIVTHVDGQIFYLFASLTIEKATYDMSGISFSDKEEPLLNEPHSIFIEGELPEGVTVEYLGNDQSTPGTYTVTAIFTGDKNYNSIDPMTAELTLYQVYKVTFAVEEIDFEETLTVKANSLVPFPEISELLPEGYAVRYWKNRESSGYITEDAITATKNMDFYAVIDKKISINYELADGVGNNNPTEMWLGDYSGNLDLEAPSKLGYSFGGWFLDAEFKTPVSKLTTAFLEGKDSFTVYAKWLNVELPGSNWQETSLIFQMTENSNRQELSSGCKRYLAGEENDCFEDIDDMICARNATAYTYANVKITYTYLPDTSTYNWSKNIEHIFTLVNSQSKDRPDIFCNFVYDMVSTSLKGSFANLYSTTRGIGALYGVNYFAFADTPNGYVDTGAGYMYEYMQSLTLSKFKMYCLASDYFIDTVRAFMVVPVNVELLNSIGVSQTADAFNSDRDGDGDFDINDFYMLVKQKKWNYNTLADFCAAIFRDEGDANAEGAAATLSDRVGFALSTSDLSSSGMLYTTSVVIIHKDWDDARNDYTYYYPEENQDLYAFCNSLNTLFTKTGVISVTDSASSAYGGNSLNAIRNRFAVNKVLFGGVICVGSLEYEEYQAMKETGKGFGVVPVPTYRTVNPKTGAPDPYLTQIHSVGRIGGISATTTKFAQCTAFLDYMSRNSTDILDEYYDYKLQYDVAGGSEGNVEMLQYIRENVRSSFDKAFEDAIGKFFSSVDEESNKNKWHVMIANANYRMTTMEAEYDRLYDTKELYLRSLVREYDILPN